MTFVNMLLMLIITRCEKCDTVIRLDSPSSEEAYTVRFKICY